MANDDDSTVTRGQSVTIDVLVNDTDDATIDPTSVEVVQAPSDGVTNVDPVTGEVTYTHNGIALDEDSFTYRVADTQGAFSLPATVTMTVQENNSSVTITVPQEGATVTSNDVTVFYQLSGTDYDHLHLSLDGNGHVTITDLTGNYTFLGVAEGLHSVIATLVSAGHQPVNGPNAEDIVNFTVDTSGGGTGLITAGLVTHLAADGGVTVNGDLVTGWVDQSGLDNDLTSAGDPRWLLGGLNGLPIIRFDGVGDKLERVGGIVGLPAGNADRTVYIVADYRSGGYGGVAYGNGACSQAFGVVAASSGNYLTQGWCPSNDFDSGVAAVGSGWAVQSVVHQAGQFTHYLNGVVIDTAVHNFNTVVNKIVVGAEIADFNFLDMDVA
ncbi:MAG: Ig-like domain-containing protein, partial [Planctomycetota bacterium]